MKLSNIHPNNILSIGYQDTTTNFYILLYKSILNQNVNKHNCLIQNKLYNTIHSSLFHTIYPTLNTELINTTQRSPNSFQII
jgi:hypothetical protein